MNTWKIEYDIQSRAACPWCDPSLGHHCLISSVPGKTNVVPGIWTRDIYTIHVMFSIIAVG